MAMSADTRTKVTRIDCPLRFAGFISSSPSPNLRLELLFDLDLIAPAGQNIGLV
jgi:hypothetical protein